ncbi:MAG: RNA 2'-phosphotransferase, partial [Planctomycetota bacterium]
MTHPELIERITRSLAYMLRHQPEQFDLELDEYGFANLDDVVQALNERLGEPIEEEDVREAVTSGDRMRYEIAHDAIRALYGHSIDVKPGEPSKPPALLYVGVSGSDADRAHRFGLRAGRRRFLHLALTPEDAAETGRRTARDWTVVTVNALDAWEEGINFYDRKSLFLSDPIPTQFLTVGDMRSDGEEPEARFEGGPARESEGRTRRRGGRGRRGGGYREDAPPVHHVEPAHHEVEGGGWEREEPAPTTDYVADEPQRESAPRDAVARDNAPREGRFREDAPRDAIRRGGPPPRREHGGGGRGGPREGVRDAGARVDAPRGRGGWEGGAPRSEPRDRAP